MRQITPPRHCGVRDGVNAVLIRPFSLLFFFLSAIFVLPAHAGNSPVFSQPSPLASNSLLVAGFSTSGLLAAVGERGHLLISRDDGVQWQQVQVPTLSMISSIFFVGERGWLTTMEGEILHSGGAGQNWQPQFSSTEQNRPLLDLWFENEKHGFAIGAYGYFLESWDGGQQWQSRNFYRDDDFHLNKITADEQGRLFVVGEAGVMYRSLDSGKRWQKLAFPYQGSLFSILALRDGGLLVVGLRGHIFYSADGGEQWRKIESGSSALLSSVRQLADGRVVVVGHDSTLLLSDVVLTHFKPWPVPKRMAIADLLETQEGRVILLGDKGVMPIELQP